MFILLAAIASTGAVDSDHRLSTMVALYDQVCLKTFPDDGAVEALMVAQGARELSRSEVETTMRDDPARGWELKDGTATVWIEFPPYHACSVRWNAPSIGDLGSYRAVADAYERALGGFEPMQPLDSNQGDIHVHLVGKQRRISAHATEALLVVDQSISDPERRAAGETGVVLRFVHQFWQRPAGRR